MRTDTLTVLLEQCAALRFRVAAALPQGRVTQHFPYRHPGRLETIEKFHPGQDRCVVVTLARLVPVGMGKQPDPLIITDGVGRQSRTLCQLANLHQRLLSSRRRESYRLECTLSQEEFEASSCRRDTRFRDATASLISKRKICCRCQVPKSTRMSTSATPECCFCGFAA